MKKSELNERYFEWLCRLVCYDVEFDLVSHQRFLRYLHNIEFVYTIDMDANRAEDGIYLRYRFGYESNYDDRMVSSLLDDRQCSVLEMLVALAVRCEENIMSDPDIGNRTGLWFWDMIDNLGLDHLDTEEHVRQVITKFLNREYEANGEGGLFTLKHCNRDLREIEIWYQLCWYLNDIV